MSRNTPNFYLIIVDNDFYAYDKFLPSASKIPISDFFVCYRLIFRGSDDYLLKIVDFLDIGTSPLIIGEVLKLWFENTLKPSLTYSFKGAFSFAIRVLL